MVFNILGALWIVFSVFLARYIILKQSKHIRHILFVIALFLFLYKSVELILNLTQKGIHKMPVEFSAVTYFLLSATILFNIKRLKSFVTYASFISGIGYLIVFVFTLQIMVSQNGIRSVVFAFINHSLLFIASVLMMRETLYTKESSYKPIIVYSVLVILYAVILYFFIDFQDYRFIYKLLEGFNLYKKIGFRTMGALLDLAYYVLVVVIYLSILKVFYRINQFVYNYGKGELETEHQAHHSLS